MKVTKAEQQGDSGVYAVARKFNDELGWIFRKQSDRDLGIDAIVEVVENSNSEGQLIALQIKSGKSWFKEETDNEITFRFDAGHWSYWTRFPLPVFVVLHRPDDGELYWQIINKDKTVSTGDGWKVAVPKSNVISADKAADIKAFCDYIIPNNSYSISSFKDEHYGGAKRYSARILLNKNLSRGEIAQVILRETNNSKKREYYRNELARSAWSGTDASVVWLFIFPSLEDEKNNNWVCKSLWISPDLEERFRPGTIYGMVIGEKLVVEWSADYESLGKLYSEGEVSKEDYLNEVSSMLKSIIQHVTKAISASKRVHSGTIDPENYLQNMRDLEPKIKELYINGLDVSSAPLECKDFDKKFQEVIALAHNIVLPFSRRGLRTWDETRRNWLVEDAIKHFKTTLDELKYELKKIR